ncbi:hypothetical protein A2803_02580 [Candidatus Woesebacteria bacterium RIFCSPHIGHO2_01_FULL_44_21]|uniref:Uncharacterized protein n=1 Tax=Candidatus Woesebacteria bacterium RIFCSPHIGHO2_01_FULL_44_21 TaxID=1802503 RepID=A0A1F7YXI9_9BACT|nr:MAG: hypothetical protein A2803_02580 [Candidatus Woesebacteria bacterium RIFCSPHIGHO2_01_FULL_44_21]OGM69842.1 MAG: hypothetical protein A2897_00665 [Candidatus Woesebacteria bacterium RIFCSPLOWO2_01_FULL_44_24b]
MKILLIILTITLFVRVLYLGDNLFFGYEQGRDFLKLTEIASGDPALIGPKTDIDGLFHGAFSYYSLLPSFIIFGGNPYLVLLSLILIHVVSVYFLYKFAKELKGKKFALLTTFVYAISYSSVVYARWLSNPNLVPALAIFFLYFLQRAKNNKMLLAFVALFWALIFHLQVIASLILLLPGAYFVVTNKLLTKRNLVPVALVIIGVLNTYLIFNFKNDNILLNGLTNYLDGPAPIVHDVKLDELNNEIVDDFFPQNRTMAFVLFWLVVGVNIIASRQDFGSRFILVLSFAAPFVFILLGVSPLRHLFILNPLFTSLLIANAAYFLFSKRLAALALITILIAFAANLTTIFARLPESNRNFIYHAQSTYLSDMENLVDYAYKDAGGAQFSYDYFSVPYWHNDAWEYMFMWYGQWRYGFLPAKNRTKVYYVFIEPDETQPKYQEDWYAKLSAGSVLLDEYTSGKLKVEKRGEK